MIVYMDTSSLMKLFVAEEGHENVRRLFRDAHVVQTSLVTYPEAMAAFARMRHNRERPAAELRAGVEQFEQRWNDLSTSKVDEQVAREAGAFAERYRLMGCDSLQLACFARLLRAHARGVVQFSSADVRLSKAAKQLVEDVFDGDLLTSPSSGGNPPTSHSPGADSASLN